MEYSIIVTIAHHDGPTFQDKCNDLFLDLETKGKKQISITTGATVIPVAQGPGGTGMITVLTAVIEYEATEDEWKQWRLGEKLKIVKP